MTPGSQKDRPISFMLFDDTDYVSGVDLIIRPEELTRGEPMRANAFQTLGGAWVDDFGRGLPTINLSGTTGWRGSASADGATHFTALRDLIVNRWADMRAAKAGQGVPADNVRLVIADQLDGFTSTVMPQQFQLRRHKSRPLLMQYQISLVDLGPLDEWTSSVAEGAQDAITSAIYSPTRSDLAMTSLSDAARRMEESKGTLGDLGLGEEMVQAARSILDVSTDLLGKVQETAAASKGIVDEYLGPVLETSGLILEASRNAFQILAAGGALADYTKWSLQRIAANFQDALCNLLNGFRRFLTIPDWSDIFGASSCSSTGGGRPISPLATTNPFESLFTADAAPVGLSQAGRQSVAALRVDPLTSSLTDGDIATHLMSMAAGVTGVTA